MRGKTIMQNKPSFKQAILFASIVAASAANAATPTQEADEVAIPITITGNIVEVVACEFSGASAGLAFDFTAVTPESENQYQADGSADLTIDCANGSDGNSYAVAMDTVDGDTVDYENRSADIAVDVGGTALTAIISANQDSAGFQTVDQDFAPVASASSSVFAFRAEIQDPNGSTGTVTAVGSPELHVRFDGESATAPVGDGPLLGLAPLGGADEPVVTAANGVLNTINGPEAADGALNPVYAGITSANAEINTLLGGGGGEPPAIPPEDFPPSSLSTTPLGDAGVGDGEEEALFGNFDTNGSGDIDEEDAPF